MPVTFQVGMFGLFGSTIGTSLETGYDWAQTSSETMGEEESFQTVAFAAPGRILHIEQVKYRLKVIFILGSTQVQDLHYALMVSFHFRPWVIATEMTLRQSSSRFMTLVQMERSQT